MTPRLKTITDPDLVLVLGWERVSTDHQDMARQDADLERLKQIYPIKYHRIVKLELSGRHVEGDPAVQAILDEIINNPMIRGIAVSSLDRIFRHERYDSGKILQILKENGKLIYSAKEGLIDPDTSNGYMLCMTAMMQSGLEWRELRRRSMDQKAVYRSRGWCVAGGPRAIPRGVIYDRIKVGGRAAGGTWRYDGVYSEKIKQAMYLIVEMGSNTNFAEVVRRIGGGYTPEGLKKALKNRIWISERVYDQEAIGQDFMPDEKKRRGGKKPLRKRKKMGMRAEPIVVKIELAPLVPLEIFEKVQEIINGVRTNIQRRRVANQDRERFLGGGLIWCSCGKLYYMNYGSQRGRTDTLFCSSQERKHDKTRVSCGAPRLRREDVDRTLIELFTGSFLKAEVIAAIEAGLRAKHARKDTGKAAREQKMAELKDQRDMVNDMRQYRKIDRVEWLRRLDQIEGEEKAVLAIAPAPQDIPYDPLEVAEGLIASFQGFGAFPFALQREVLRAVISRITIDGDKQSIMSMEFNGAWLTRVSAPIGKTPGKTPEEKISENRSPKKALTPVITGPNGDGTTTRSAPWSRTDCSAGRIPGPDLTVKLSKPLQIRGSKGSVK